MSEPEYDQDLKQLVESFIGHVNHMHGIWDADKLNGIEAMMPSCHKWFGPIDTTSLSTSTVDRNRAPLVQRWLIVLQFLSKEQQIMEGVTCRLFQWDAERTKEQQWRQRTAINAKPDEARWDRKERHFIEQIPALFESIRLLTSLRLQIKAQLIADGFLHHEMDKLQTLRQQLELAMMPADNPPPPMKQSSGTSKNGCMCIML